MTVSFLESIHIRPWRGYDDPGLPVGMYFAQGAVTGDASGGDMLILFGFKGEGEPVSGRFFNLEQINIFHSSNLTKQGHIVANNFETLGPVGLVNRQWRFSLIDNRNDVSAMNEGLYLPLPLFLGSVAPVASLAADLEVGIDNVDVTSLVATIQGYIWEPRSVQAEGGLRRPVDSLYGGGRG